MSSVSNSIATMPNEAALSANDDIIRSLILTMRGVQVILDRDIAKLYGVETKVLNQAVKRNRERFPDRFMFRLTGEDIPGLRSQIVTLNKGQGQHLTPAAVAKFNKQNPSLTVKAVAAFHDRFLILDGTELYHLGASLKDLGRKYCAVTRMDALFIPSIMQRI